MPPLIDLSGRTFHRWRVIRRTDNARHKPHWLCQCECGTFSIVSGGNLRSGISKSCGCLARELQSKANIIHGQTSTPFYTVWLNAKARCYNKGHHSYPRYGGRGITMCDKWRNSFESFAADMGDPPDGYMLERIDNNGNYEPSNCKWATPSEQATNQERNPRIEWRGERLRLTEWANKLGLPKKALRSRKHHGWPVERMLTQPFRKSPSKTQTT